jgi:hypothetical protein
MVMVDLPTPPLRLATVVTVVIVPPMNLPGVLLRDNSHVKASRELEK